MVLVIGYLENGILETEELTNVIGFSIHRISDSEMTVNIELKDGPWPFERVRQLVVSEEVK